MKSIKPTKQRKRLHQANINERYRRFSVHLSSKLRDSHDASSIPVRKGDTVMVIRGDRKSSEGKVTQLEQKKYRLVVEGANREKVDGTNITISIHPSNVIITRLNLDDKWRKEILERKQTTGKPKIAKEEPQKKETKTKKKKKKVTKKAGGA